MVEELPPRNPIPRPGIWDQPDHQSDPDDVTIDNDFLDRLDDDDMWIPNDGLLFNQFANNIDPEQIEG